MKVATTTTEQILKELKTTRDGLSVVEVEKRLKKYGSNALPSKPKKSPFVILVNQFKSPLVYILLIAAVISLITNEIGDSIIILLVLLINAGVGYYQEAKAENTLYQLKQILPQEALVKRGGDIEKVIASELVPGDVILLKAGERVVADVKVITSVDLSVNEAFLTGEARPVKKQATKRGSKVEDDTSSLVYAGSSIQYGEGEAVVIATGQKTKLGNIAKLVHDAKDIDTPLQKRIKELANKLLIILIVITICIFALGVSTGYTYAEMINISVALAVSAIPEGLLIAITVILAIGMQRILKQRALVKKLLAAETLGSTSVICTDKTGTLTEGSMKVTRIITTDSDVSVVNTHKNKKMSVQRMIDVAIYCNDGVIQNYQLPKEQWKLIGRPTDRSLLQLALDLNINIIEKRRALPRTTYIPFDSKIKFMATVNAVDEEARLIFVKGAPEKIIAKSVSTLTNDKETPLSERHKTELLHKAIELSSKGYRVLAAGYKKEKKLLHKLSTDEVNGIIFVGFYIIEDPIRPEAAATIKIARKAGITTVMITGDHPKTALSIARQLKLSTTEDAILTGDELNELSDEQLHKKVTSIKVYARVAPEDKVRIVRAWQKVGHVVAMTGDGINDAPALKEADIGIGIGSGTEVAKEAADIILLDDNFKTIVMAVAEGRVIFTNVKKVTLILLSDSFAELIIIGFALAIAIPLPLIAVQILWINVLTDGLPDIALSAEPADKNVLERKPIRKGASILDLRGKVMIGLISTGMAIAVLVTFFYAFEGEETLIYARTLAFTLFALASLAVIFSIRDLERPFWRRSPLDNKFLFVAVLLSIVLQIAVVYVPFLQEIFETTSLSILNWFVVVLVSFALMFLTEGVKWTVPKLIPEYSTWRKSTH